MGDHQVPSISPNFAEETKKSWYVDYCTQKSIEIVFPLRSSCFKFLYQRAVILYYAGLIMGSALVIPPPMITSNLRLVWLGPGHDQRDQIGNTLAASGVLASPFTWLSFLSLKDGFPYLSKHMSKHCSGRVLEYINICVHIFKYW